jgi:LacI family transcriptional regulator
MASRKIAVLVGPGHGFNMGVLRGISQYAAATGPWEFLSQSPGLSFLAVREWTVDGVIVPLRSEEHAQIFRNRGVPTVNCSGALRDPGVPTVRPDDREAGRLGAQHLMERGFRNLAYCGFQEYDFSEIRRQGFEEAVQRAGLEPIVFRADPAIRNEWTWDRQQMDIARWLKTLPLPAGVMASMDERSWHVADACNRAGLRVPQDVAIVGVDNDQVRCEFTNPPLSSVAVSAERIGYESAAMLGRLMSGTAPPPGPVLVKPEGVVVRASSDTLVAGDEAVVRAFRFVHDHASDPGAFEEAVREAGAERRDLSERFRRCLGRTLEEELLRARVGRAERLLVETDLDLAQVAQASGFITLARLRDALRRRTGFGPSEYRDRHRLR